MNEGSCLEERRVKTVLKTEQGTRMMKEKRE